jgi:hypothetical protein
MPSLLRACLRATLLLVLPTVMVCLVMLEAGLRLSGRLPSNTTDGIFEAHGTETYRLRKNMTKVSRTPSYACVIHTNAFGLRDRAPGVRSLGPAPYYAFLGDSLTFANGVDYEASFVGVFADLARPRGVEALNLGVGGHRLSDQEEQLRDFLASAPQRPARVVVVFTAQFVTGFEDRYSDLFVKNGYLFRRGAWLLPYVTVTLGNSSSAYCFVRDGLRKLQHRISPPGQRTALELLQIYSKEEPWGRPAVVQRLESRLDALDELIRRGTGAPPIYVYLPTAADLRAGELLALTGQPADRYDFQTYETLLERHCARSGIPFVSLAPVLAKRHAEGRPLSFMQDMHYNADTNAVIGQALHDALLPGAEPPTGDGTPAVKHGG